ncbi:hypothetical protein H4582DRAFT_1903327 [Lactarius indigo]|nr:hypothetical protein H4582DRAFT_1903327 [Lactarius indigo]
MTELTLWSTPCTLLSRHRTLSSIPSTFILILCICSSTPSTLSSMPRVIIRASVAAMRVSSSVNLSSRWSASSTSLLPTRFLRYLFSLPCFISFVTIPRIESTSTMIFTMMSIIAAVGRTSIYFSSRKKKYSKRPNRYTRVFWLARTSLAA